MEWPTPNNEVTALPKLTDNQLKIAQRYNIGHLHKEIANDLGLSLKGVEYNISRITKKLEAKNFRHACHLLRQGGII